MSTSYTSRRTEPELNGVFPPGDPVFTTGGQDPAGGFRQFGPALWADGDWRAGELRRHRCERGSVLVMGQCLAGEREFAEEAERALAGGKLIHLTRWPGSYTCFVVRPGELTVFVDLAGQYPLYYRYRQDRTWLGSRPAAVAAAAGGGRIPDRQVLAARILCPEVPLVDDSRSVLDGVRRLGGGQALRIGPDGRNTRWTYETPLPDPETSLQESAEALGTALDRAVRLRVSGAGTLTADFSGGLDSTSLAFLALRHRPDPLPVFTYHQAGAASEDLAHARRYARLDDRLRLEVVTGTSATLPYQELDRAACGDEPDFAAVGAARTRLRLERVARHGGGLHLGGEGGDALLVVPPAYLAGLVRPGGLRELGRHGHALARLRHTSPLGVVARSVRLSRTPFTSALRRTAGHLERPGSPAPGWIDTVGWWPAPGPESGWLTTPARQELAGLARAQRESEDGRSGLGPDLRTTLHELRTSADAQRQLSLMAAEFGVRTAAPFLDSDVIRACLGLSAQLRAEPSAFKPLLGAALAGMVPPPVLGRRTKGDYSDEDHQGARRASAVLRDILHGSQLAALGIIEPAAVTASLDRALMGLRAPFPALNRLLGTELWLRQHFP